MPLKKLETTGMPLGKGNIGALFYYMEIGKYYSNVRYV
jgi:hypothetical protein